MFNQLLLFSQFLLLLIVLESMDFISASEAIPYLIHINYTPTDPPDKSYGLSQPFLFPLALPNCFKIREFTSSFLCLPCTTPLQWDASGKRRAPGGQAD